MSLRNTANLWKYALCLLLLAGTIAIHSTPNVQAQDSAGLPMGDIVFVFDESGSFYDDHDIVERNLNYIASLLNGVIDYRLGLVGFGAYRGHGGTEYEGQPHIALELTSDLKVFAEAMKTMVLQGKAEYGFNAIQLAASDLLGYRAGAAPCIIMITDEDADVSEEDPVTKEDAIVAIQRAGAYFLGVVAFDFGNTVHDYGPAAGSVAQATGGRVFDINEFRENPVPVLSEIVTRCIHEVQENGMPSDETPPDTDGQQEQQPDQDGDDDGGGGLISGGGNVDLAPIVTRLVDQQATLFTRLRLLEERVTAIENLDITVNIPVQIEEKITNIEVTLARYDVLFDNIDANFTQIDARLNAIEGNVSSIHASIAELRERDMELAQRMQSIEARLADLEAQTDLSMLLAWRDEAQARLDELNARLTDVDGQFAAVQAKIAELGDEHAGFSAQFEEIYGRLSDTEARLDALSASLTARIDELTEQLNSFDARFQELSAQLANLDVDALNARLNAFSGELDGLRATVNENRDQISQLHEMAAGWDQEIADLNARLTSLAGQVEELSALGSQIADLSARFDSLEGRVDSNETAVGELRAEIADLQAQIEDVLRQLDENAFALQADLDSLASSLGSRIQSLLRRIQSLEAAGTGPDQATLDQLENLANLISQLQVRMAELTSKQNGQYEELSGRIDTNEEWIMMIEAYLGIGGEAKEGETSLDQRINNIEDSLSDLSAQIRENGRAVQDFQRVIDELNQRISELEARPIGGEGDVVDPARLRAAQRLAELAFLTAVASIGLSLLFFLSES